MDFKTKLLQKARGPRDGGKGEVKGEGIKKRIQMCYVHVPIPHDECKHYILQTRTTKIKTTYYLNASNSLRATPMRKFSLKFLLQSGKKRKSYI